MHVTLHSFPTRRSSDLNQVEKSVNDRNLSFFEQEVNKLDAWADDLKEGLEASTKELDKQIKEVRREAKIAVTLEEKLAQIGRAHVRTPVTWPSRMPSPA